MALLSLLDVSHAFGGPPVLDHVNFQVNAGERLCLLGRNGAGKSTLMKLIAARSSPMTGQIFRQPGAHFARLVQEVPTGTFSRHRARHRLLGPALVRARHEEDWEREVRLEDLINHVGLLDSTRGVLRAVRRLETPRAAGPGLASQPDLLLLDEPTNHLDLASILWLEEFLLQEKIGLFFVTHDRAFLKKLATRIVELDRGIITNWDCDYDTFLVRRQDRPRGRGAHAGPRRQEAGAGGGMDPPRREGAALPRHGPHQPAACPPRRLAAPAAPPSVTSR